MAIYHLSVQTISRGQGKSCVASAAYRAGEKIFDEKQQLTHNYTKKQGIESEIIAPSGAPEWVKDRQRLWNEVDRAETRCNSRTAREINVALPLELTKDQQKELARNFVKENFVDKGMVADLCFHFNDSNNPHFHVMLTTREISQEGFTVKNRAWDKKELVEEWREQWSNHANKALEKAGCQERIDHRSYQEQGVDQLPTIHLGKTACEMQQRGISNPRAELNEQIQEVNKQKVIALQEYKELKAQLEEQKVQQQAKYKYLNSFEKTAVMYMENKLGDNFSYKAVQELYNTVRDKFHDIGLKRDKIDFEAIGLSNEIKYLETHISGIERAEREIDKLSKGLFGSLKKKDEINDLKYMIKNYTEGLQSKGIASVIGARSQLRVKSSQLEQLTQQRNELINSAARLKEVLKPVEDCLKALNNQKKMVENESSIVGTLNIKELKSMGKELSYQEVSLADYKKLLKTNLQFAAMQNEKGTISIAIDKKDDEKVIRFLSKSRAFER